MKKYFPIKQIIIAVVFVLLSVQLSYAKPVQLKNFKDVFAALKAGETVKGVFHYKMCKLISDNEEVEKVPDAIGGFTILSFEYFAPGSIRNKQGFISTSKTVLINHPRYGFVKNYAKIRIFDDNKIRIIAQYITPNTYEIKMDESFYTVINDGKNKGGAYFYVDR
jgi:hypothetical protein